jgi:hypothetical protein
LFLVSCVVVVVVGFEAMQPRQLFPVTQHANAPENLHVARAPPLRLPAHFKVGDEITIATELPNGNVYSQQADQKISGGRIVEITKERTHFSCRYYFSVKKHSVKYNRMNKIDNRNYTTSVRTYTWNKSFPWVEHMAVSPEKHYSAGCEDFIVVEVDPPGFGQCVAEEDEECDAGSDEGSDGYMGSGSDVGTDDETEED